MKTVRNSLTLLATSMVVFGTVQAQDNMVLSHQPVTTNAFANITLEMKTEPTLKWGSRMEVSGLFVDLIKPQQTWLMLNPSNQARALAMRMANKQPPLMAPVPIIDTQEPREADFAVLKFSF